MPKMKSRRNALKRLRVTANGNFKRRKAFRSHILTSKSSKRKRHLRRSGLIAKTEAYKMRRHMLA